MQAMILAAGRGARMGALTERVPKPLLKINGEMIIVRLLKSLVVVGIKEIVINTHHMGDKIRAALGDGNQYGASIQYSQEADQALETGGGILKALPLLGDDPFVVISGDLWTDYPWQNLPKQPRGLAHVVLVDNPEFHPQGDFVLQGEKVLADGDEKLTYGNIGVYRKALFANSQPGKFPVAPLLRQAMQQDQVTGEHYQGNWVNIGTPEQLQALNTADKSDY